MNADSTIYVVETEIMGNFCSWTTKVVASYFIGHGA